MRSGLTEAQPPAHRPSMPAVARSVLFRAPCELHQLLKHPTNRFLSASSSIRDARPPTAPKQFPDLRAIRANPIQYSDNCLLRNYTEHAKSILKIVSHGTLIKDLDAKLHEPRRQIKRLSAQLAPGRDCDPQTTDSERAQILEELSGIRVRVKELEDQRARYEEDCHTLALSLPNLTSTETPIMSEPRVLQHVNFDPKNPPSFSQTADHSHIGKELSLLDFTSASKTTGWGFYYLLNEAALLEQALVQYALSIAMRRGWRVVSPPSLVYSHMADACGFQPRDRSDEQQIWHIAQPEGDWGKPRRSLAATAEIPLAGLFASSSIPRRSLPMKLVGSSRCFRAEAGARGVDTKGLYRVHEFTKVEMFAWSQDDLVSSTAVFDEMIEIQTEILTSLGLPFRILEMPVTDLGASAFRKIDIEAMFPSRRDRDEGWGEVTSASICTEYQSRRLDTRILDKSGGKSAFPQTVNGTALAVPRVLAALLENHWDEKRQSVTLPAVLRPFMGGLETIEKRRVP